MNAEHQLREAYQQWRQLAESEGQAIQSGDWMRVCDCQEALKNLQERVIHYTAEAQDEWAREGADRTAKEKHFHEVVKSLIEIEWRNNSFLNVHRRDPQAGLRELAATSACL